MVTIWNLQHLGHKLVAPNREKQRQLPAELRASIHECKNCGWMFVVGRSSTAMPYGPGIAASELDSRLTEPCPGPIPEVDRNDLSGLSASAMSEISKAHGRLNQGDESGAISSACGAVDLSTDAILRRHRVSNPRDLSFAARVRESTKVGGAFDSLERDLAALQMNPDDLKFVRDNLVRAISASAEVLGRLRSSMGDVHGSKPALKPIVRTCIKLASAVSGLLDGVG